MSKRHCPFSDSRSQKKVHISEKEVSNGVLQNQMMKAVYDRTRNLLYQGAKGAVTLTPSAEFPSPMRRDTNLAFIEQFSSTQPPFSLKQMTLNQHGQLQPSVFTQPDQPAAPKTCYGCEIDAHQEMMSCAFCDCSVCGNCVVICSKCQEPFCSTCTFNMYETAGSHICTNCY